MQETESPHSHRHRTINSPFHHLNPSLFLSSSFVTALVHLLSFSVSFSSIFPTLSASPSPPIRFHELEPVSRNSQSAYSRIGLSCCGKPCAFSFFAVYLTLNTPLTLSISFSQIGWVILFIAGCVAGLHGASWWIIVYQLLYIVGLYCVLAKDTFAHYHYSVRNSA